MKMIECAQVCYSYFTGAGEVVVLQGLDLTIQRGEHVAIVGPSGAGKSTLLRLCAALDKPRNGDVFVDGIHTKRLNGKELARFRRERVGLVFQQFSLLPALSAVENVMLPLLPYCSRHVLRKRAKSLLNEMDLGERMEHYPDQLSGGEQQRVAIARSMIASPPLLLADEPTGSLDPVTGKQVITLLDTLCREHGCTLVVVTHDANIAAMAGRTLHMIDGCLKVASTR
jgi:predicted ABC-type transport system involved in lysophospholipase L1 biosynthesis ATPase subunit